MEKFGYVWIVNIYFRGVGWFNTHYCVLDLAEAYQQLLLSLYQFKRLCFGVASAPSIFQSVMDQMLLGMKDDILIGFYFQSCHVLMNIYVIINIENVNFSNSQSSI